MHEIIKNLFDLLNKIYIMDKLNTYVNYPIIRSIIDGPTPYTYIVYNNISFYFFDNYCRMVILNLMDIEKINLLTQEYKFTLKSEFKNIIIQIDNRDISKLNDFVSDLLINTVTKLI